MDTTFRRARGQALRYSVVAPTWLLEGRPAYIVITKRVARKNDGSAQMRNLARQLTPAEIDSLAGFYAKR